MPVFELTGATIGKRELVGSQQFYVHYGEAFTVHFKLDGVELHLHFRQEFNGDNAGGYFKIDEDRIDLKSPTCDFHCKSMILAVSDAKIQLKVA